MKRALVLLLVSGTAYAGGTVRRSADQYIEGTCSHQTADAQLQQVSAGDEKHRDRRQYDQDCGAKVRLQHDQTRNQADEHTKRHEAIRYLTHFGPF